MSDDIEQTDDELAGYEFDDDGRITLVLKRPVKFGEQRITELRFRELKGKDMRRIRAQPGENMAVIMTLAGKLTGQPTPVIDELVGSDLRRVVALTQGFMNGSLEIGDGSSEP